MRAAFLLFALAGSLPAQSLVWNFDGAESARTGRFGAFQSPGCEINVQLSSAARRGTAGLGIEIAYRNHGGTCGVWMHLFPEAEPGARDFPDSREYPFFSFWVRAKTMPADAEVRMADPIWLARDDSKTAGTVSHYIRRPLTAGWTETVIPFADFHLPSHFAAVFALSFPPGAEGVLDLDDVAMKRHALDAVPVSSLSPSGLPVFRAMWLWETSEAIATEESRAASVDGLRRAEIVVVYLQFVSGRASQLRHFLRLAHAAGISVQALDGYPDFALRERHAEVLALVREILAFNREAPTEERFDGIHFDIEPHQLLGFDSPLRRSLLDEFLEIQEKIRVALRASPDPPAYWLDIPFWLHQEPGITRRIFDFADGVAIMAYRRWVAGEDGIVANAAVTVRQAGDAGRGVFVGVETEEAVESYFSVVCEMPENTWNSQHNLSWPLLRKSDIDGFPLRSRTDGKTRSIGLAANPRRGAAPYRQALQSLALACGQWPGPVGEVITVAPPREIVEPAQPKITFAGSKFLDFEKALAEVADSFRGEKGFAGVAIHSFSSYRKNLIPGGTMLNR